MFQVRCISRYLSVPPLVIFVLGKRTEIQLCPFTGAEILDPGTLKYSKKDRLGTQKWVEKQRKLFWTEKSRLSMPLKILQVFCK